MVAMPIRDRLSYFFNPEKAHTLQELYRQHSRTAYDLSDQIRLDEERFETLSQLPQNEEDALLLSQKIISAKRKLRETLARLSELEAEMKAGGVRVPSQNEILDELEMQDTEAPQSVKRQGLN